MTDPDRFLRDLLADCMASALAHQWRDRANVIRAARPREGDYLGQSTVEAQRERWRRMTAIAAACDAKATLVAKDMFPEVDDAPIWLADFIEGAA